MKPINEYTLQECLSLLNGTFCPSGEKTGWNTMSRELTTLLADRIHELTRWIPVEERLPTKEDGLSVVTINKNMKCCITLWHNIDKLNVPATHWRRIDKPEGV